MTEPSSDSDKPHSCECAICLEEATNPVILPCRHSFCDGCLNNWRSKFGDVGFLDANEARELWCKGCPMCRAKIPPTKEMIAQLQSYRECMERSKEDDDNEGYLMWQARYERLKANIGEYDEKDVIGRYGSIQLTENLAAFVKGNDIHSIMNWIGVPADKERLEAGYPLLSYKTMLHLAAMEGSLEAITVILQAGADINSTDANGTTPFCSAIVDYKNKQGSSTLETCKLLMEWGAIVPEKQKTIALLRYYRNDEYEGYHELASILSNDLGGRRCEINGMKNRTDLNTKTCIVGEYIQHSGRYSATIESTGAKVAVKPENLTRRDRTPEDCGYFIEVKCGDSFRPGYSSKEKHFCYMIMSLVGTEIKTGSLMKYIFASKHENEKFIRELNEDRRVVVESVGERAVKEHGEHCRDMEKDIRKHLRKYDKAVEDAMVTKNEWAQWTIDHLGLDGDLADMTRNFYNQMNRFNNT